MRSRSILLIVVLLSASNLAAQSAAEKFDKCYEDFRSIKTLMFNVTFVTSGKRAGRTVDVDGRFGLLKRDLELKKFRYVATIDVGAVNLIHYDEAIYNGGDFYLYNFDKRRYENKGTLYAQYQGKRKTRTSMFFFSGLTALYQEFEKQKTSIVYLVDSTTYSIRIPQNDDKGQAIMFFEHGHKLPYKVIEYDEPGNNQNYTTLTLSNVRYNVSFPDNYFETPNTEGAVEHKNTTTVTEPILLDTKDRELLVVNTIAPSWEAGAETNIKSNSYLGKVVIMDFWATWCAPCVKAMSALQRIHEKYQDAVVLGFNDGENTIDLDEYKARKHLSYTLLPCTAKISDDYKINSLPTIYVIDKTGKIIFASTGYDDNDEDTLNSVIEMALKMK